MLAKCFYLKEKFVYNKSEMNQEQIVELFINQEDYNKDDLYYIFTDKISELAGEEFSPHHEYSINYEKKLYF